MGVDARLFAQRVSVTLMTRLVGVAIGIVTLSVTTRLLGPAGRGQFAVLMALIATVVQFGHFGLHAASTYWLARRPEDAGRVGSLLFWFALAVSATLSGIVLTIVIVKPAVLGHVPVRLALLALLASPPSLFLMLVGNALLGLGRAYWFNLLDFAGKLIGLAAVVSLFWSGIAALFVVYAVLQYGLALIAYVRLAGNIWPRVPKWSDVRPLFEYGARIFVVGLFMYLVLRQDLFLVNGLAGVAQAGQYSVAVQVAEILNLTTASIAAMLFPSLSGMQAAARWSATKRVLRVTGLLLGVMALALAVSSQPLFAFWFGSQFAPGAIALLWLLPGLWCLGMNTVLHQHLAACGMPWFLAWATGLGAALNLLLNVWLVPSFGILGAAAASTLTYSFLLFATTVYLLTPTGRVYRA